MVCEKCDAKLQNYNKLATVHRNPSSSSTPGSSKMIAKNENKLLTMKSRFKKEHEQYRKCRICGKLCHHALAHYCQNCAYQKGICFACGRKIIESGKLQSYKQSLT